jgi:hypothetical protein
MKKWTVILPAMLLALMVMGGVAFAQTAGGNGTPAATGLMGLLKGLGCGALTGFLISFIAWLDKRAQDPASPNYNFEKSAGTIIWGALLGAAFGWTSIDLTKWNDFRDTTATVLIGQLIGKLGLHIGTRAAARMVAKFRAHAAAPPKA